MPPNKEATCRRANAWWVSKVTKLHTWCSLTNTSPLRMQADMECVYCIYSVCPLTLPGFEVVWIRKRRLLFKHFKLRDKSGPSNPGGIHLPAQRPRRRFQRLKVLMPEDVCVNVMKSQMERKSQLHNNTTTFEEEKRWNCVALVPVSLEGLGIYCQGVGLVSNSIISRALQYF